MSGQGQNDHGVDPTPTTPATPQTTPAADPTQGGKTQPIGGADGGPGLYRPQGLPDHLFGQSDTETLDKVTKAYLGAREAIGKAGSPPEKADAYTFTWSDKVKGLGTIADNDPAIAAFRDIALEHGYTQQQIDAIPKFFETMIDKGIVEQPADPKALLMELAPDGFRGDDAAREAEGSKRLLTAENWIRQLAPASGFDDAMKEELRLLTTSKAGVRVVETLMKGGMNPSVSPGGAAAADGISKESLEARIADPRNDVSHPKYNEAYATETQRQFKAFYG